MCEITASADIMAFEPWTVSGEPVIRLGLAGSVRDEQVSVVTPNTS
jgi:hypothetical protein